MFDRIELIDRRVTYAKTLREQIAKVDRLKNLALKLKTERSRLSFYAASEDLLRLAQDMVRIVKEEHIGDRIDLARVKHWDKKPEPLRRKERSRK